MQKIAFFTVAFVFSCFSLLQAQRQVIIQTSHYVVDDKYDDFLDTKAKQKLDNYKEGIDEKISKKIGESSRLMTAEMPESLLTNFVTDVLLIKGAEYLHDDIDLSILNIGCFRNVMPGGDITIGDIYDIFPFDNVVEILYIRGKYLRELFDDFSTCRVQPMGNTVLIFRDQELEEVFIGEAPLRDEKLYKVATLNYLRNGGDRMGILNNAEKVVNTRTQLRDMVIKYISEQHHKGEQIHSSLDNRVIFN